MNIFFFATRFARRSFQSARGSTHTERILKKRAEERAKNAGRSAMVQALNKGLDNKAARKIGEEWPGACSGNRRTTATSSVRIVAAPSSAAASNAVNTSPLVTCFARRSGEDREESPFHGGVGRASKRQRRRGGRQGRRSRRQEARCEGAPRRGRCRDRERRRRRRR